MNLGLRDYQKYDGYIVNLLPRIIDLLDYLELDEALKWTSCYLESDTHSTRDIFKARQYDNHLLARSDGLVIGCNFDVIQLSNFNRVYKWRIKEYE